MENRSSNLTGGQIIGVGAVFAIIIGLAMAIAGPGTDLNNKWQQFTNGAGQQIQSATGTSVAGPPTISAAKIDQILTNAGSPAAGTGQDLYNLGVQYGIDPAFPLAFFKKESTFGKYGIAVQTRGLGNIRCSDGYYCIGGFRAYSSWADGYRDWYELIKGPVYVGGGLVTVEQIVPKYAPAADHNNPIAYIASVNQDVQTWRAG